MGIGSRDPHAWADDDSDSYGHGEYKRSKEWSFARQAALEAEVKRLRAAFLRHKDGGWTFVETYDGRWIRVADDFARAALDQGED